MKGKKVIRMAEKISLEALFSKLIDEKKTGELLSLPTTFYTDADKYIQTTKEGETENGEKKAKNFIKTLESLKQKRIQKILVYLAYNKNPPKPIPIEEEETYAKIKKILKDDLKSEKTTKIKIRADIPEIITTHGQKIGPYKQNEIIEINNDLDVDFITNNKIGEIID